jgi:hypothetical protein
MAPASVARGNNAANAVANTAAAVIALPIRHRIVENPDRGEPSSYA